MEFKQPSLSSIADFLTYLLNDKNLKPTTIAGYRTAIADHLGPADTDISHSFELNRLISSFHGDRPVKDRGIPSWDLSLVLLALTKPPFEPLKEVPLIYLFGVLRCFQHCTGHITTGSWKGRGNQYIEFVRVLYCKLLTNVKQLPAFPLEVNVGARTLVLESPFLVTLVPSSCF